MSKDKNPVSKDTPRELAVFNSHTADVVSLAFSPDGSKLASAGYDGDVIIWDVAGRCVERKIHHDELNMFSAAFSSDGKLLVCTDWERMYIHNATTGELLRVLREAGGTLSSSAEDTVTLAINSCYDMKIIRINPHSYDVQELVNRQAVSSDVRILSADGRLTLHDEGCIHDNVSDQTRCVLSPPPGQGHPSFSGGYNAVFSPDNSLVAVSWLRCQVWNAANGDYITKLPGSIAAFSPDGNQLAVETEDHIRAYSTRDWQVCLEYHGPATNARTLAYSPDGSVLVSGEHGGRVRFWDTASGGLLYSPVVHIVGVEELQVSETDQYVQSQHRSSFTADWEVERCKLKTLHSYRADMDSSQAEPNKCCSITNSEPTRVYATSSDRRLAVTSDGEPSRCWFDSTVLLIDTVTHEPLHRLRAVSKRGHAEPIVSVVFSRDGHKIALGHLGFAVSLWDVKTGELEHFIPARGDSIGALAFSPDSRTLAIGTDYDSRIQLFDTATGREMRVLHGHTNSVAALAYSADGKFLFSGSRDGSIKMWNPHSGELLKTFLALVSDDPNQIHPDWVVYSPDGRFNCSPGAMKHLRWNVGDRFLRV